MAMTQEATEQAVALAKATMQMWDERARAAERRVYGVRAIREAMQVISGARIYDTKVKRLLRSKTFPWSHDALGKHVLWWELERWMRSRPTYAAEAKS